MDNKVNKIDRIFSQNLIAVNLKAEHFVFTSLPGISPNAISPDYRLFESLSSVYYLK